MSTSVSWETAERVGAFVGSRRGRFGLAKPPAPIDEGALDALRHDFDEATLRAESLVEEATGLHPPGSPPRGQVVDRADWIRANLRTFDRLLAPFLEDLDKLTGAGSPMLASITPKVTGAQLGVVLGWMSTRVLGQYDLLLTDDPDDTGDQVFYVGPNILELERRHGFPPRQFRQWIALHEVTHRCQFTGIEWLRPYFLSLVNEMVSAMPSDPGRLADTMQRVVKEIRAGRNPISEHGMVGLVAGPEQLVTVNKIQAMMSLLEGHGDVTMDRAGAGIVTEAAWFARVLRERRKKAGPAARLLQQLIGMEAKLRQYQQGEQFIAAVERSGGPELFAQVWTGPEQLPTMDEIRDPALWIARIGTPELATG